MGNYRFRLSDMMPNAWFYKLKDMNKPKTQNTTKKRLPSSTTPSSHQKHQQPFHNSQSRNSFYYTPRANHFYNSPTITNYQTVPSSNSTHFPPPPPPPYDPPRKSSKRSRTKRKTIYKPSPKHTLNSVQTHPESTQPQDHFFHSPKDSIGTISPSPEPDHHDHSPSTESTQSLNELTSWSSSCSCRVSSSATDIIIDKNEKPSKKVDHGFYSIPELDLPPIITNSTPQFRKISPKLNDRESSGSFSVKKVNEHDTTKSTTHSRKSVSYSNGMKLRSNSPRIELISKRVNVGHGGHARKSLKLSSVQRNCFSKSMAIMKSSFDPQKDFRESMVEMIVENNIRASQDLEELLACYLTLNSDEYHDLIIKAFEQIWFSLPSF